MSAVGVMLFILILVCVVFLVIFLALKYGKEEEDEQDNPLIINLISHKCDGRAIGMQRDITYGKDGRVLRKMTPKDIHYRKKEKRKIEDVDVITERGKSIEFPKGTLSKEKNIIIALPKSSIDFPDSLKESDLGKVLMFYTELKNCNKTEIDALKQGLDWQRDHIKSLGGGEASIEAMENLKSLYKDAAETMTDTRKEKKNAPFIPPSKGG